MPPEVVETCDAAVCGACRGKCGWKVVANMIICRRGRAHGCDRESIDRCHVHAGSGMGSDAWIGAAGVRIARVEVRAACRMAGGAT